VDCLSFSKAGWLPLHSALEGGDLATFKAIVFATEA
jgi:ankyrin repeat protein